MAYDSDPSSTPQLDYAPAPPRRRKWIRRIILALLFIGLPLATWRYGPPVWRQAQILYFQRQCMNYTASPEQVIYEEEPAAAAKLLAGDSQYGKYPINRVPSPTQSRGTNAAAFVPTCFDNIAGLFVPNSIRNLPAPIGQPAIAFLHERVSPASHRRLVYVMYFPSQHDFSPYFIAGFDYRAELVQPATLTQPPFPILKGYAYSAPSSWPRTPPNVRMYAGQIDPADASHFTIRYEMWGQSDILDGRLDDADYVTLKPRNPPQWR